MFAKRFGPPVDGLLDKDKHVRGIRPPVDRLPCNVCEKVPSTGGRIALQCLRKGSVHRWTDYWTRFCKRNPSTGGRIALQCLQKGSVHRWMDCLPMLAKRFGPPVDGLLDKDARGIRSPVDGLLYNNGEKVRSTGGRITGQGYFSKIRILCKTSLPEDIFDSSMDVPWAGLAETTTSLHHRPTRTIPESRKKHLDANLAQSQSRQHPERHLNLQPVNTNRWLTLNNRLHPDHPFPLGAVRSMDYNPYHIKLLASGASSISRPPFPSSTDRHSIADPLARAIQWHPEVATQLWVASEKDQAPSVQLWDLRYATDPNKTFRIHQPAKNNNYWCPRNPALIASSSFDGNVTVYSINGGAQAQVQMVNKIADSFPGVDSIEHEPVHPFAGQPQPICNDLKRPAGACFWVRRNEPHSHREPGRNGSRADRMLKPSRASAGRGHSLRCLREKELEGLLGDFSA
ncbi:vesicle associated protein [Culex quinquefasciatus]|uniref:Vesicle associated protein n=1 Tax=Culex quinquefasciatus TaxID=7176 RepID=B0XBH4_CULQU|nr:vesicle associated protein [Culex quinquefasciatus]|eukprot:XP_001866996.1 vesicle associated protein [Culex quinquefasciatus]